jgi:hypothetical protein
MSFGSWFKNLFSHVTPHKLAGALGAAKATVDALAVANHWDWVPQFDSSALTAITALESWQKGQPTAQITEALQLSVNIINQVEGLSVHDKSLVAIYVGAAESALAFVG